MKKNVQTRLIVLLTVLALSASLVLPARAVEDSEHDAYTAQLTAAGFPSSYLEPLWKLHRQYPLWRFTPFVPSVDWATALEKESALGMSLVLSDADSSWKSTQAGAYNWTTSTWVLLDSGGWVQASRALIAYYLDPRNFLTADTVFQFLDHRFDAAAHTQDGLRSMVSGSFLADETLDLNGDPSDGVNTYISSIFAACSEENVNPYIIVSLILQEQGAKGQSISISGSSARFPGYYNYFGIGAYMADGYTAAERGLWYAAGGNNASTSYGRPWNTRQRAIAGGISIYASEYLSAGQTNLYLKRFNVQGAHPCTHQYMADVSGAFSEARLLSRAYTEELRAQPLSFLIPVYAGMPDVPAPLPSGSGSVNDKLLSLSLSGCILTPAFDRDITEYTAVVPQQVSSVTVSAAACDASAIVKGTGELPLAVGSNTLSVSVTASNGAEKLYTVYISRQEQSAVPPAQPTPEPVPSPAPPALLRGDVSGDGAIMINDLIRLRNHILGTEPLTDEALLRADADGDGTVLINDLIKLRNHILGTSALA